MGAPVDHGLTDRQQRRTLWKLDGLLMPVLTISYGLAFYDKAILGSASVFGIIEDLGLSTVTPTGAVSTIRYSTATAAFYWGYIISVLPIALLFQVIPLGKGCAAFIFIWGAIVFLTCAVQNYPGLTAQRVFLGAVEAAVSPGFVAITNMFYTKAEIGVRLGYWYSATGIFSMFSGALNYGLGSINSSLSTWKIMYLFAGAWTVVWSAVVLFAVPDSIAKSGRFFSHPERQFLAWRMRNDWQGADDRKLRWPLFLDAIKDPLVYVYMVLASLIYLCNGGVTAFGARIIRTFGYTSLQSIALQIPGGATTCLAIYFCTFLDRKFKNRACDLLMLSCLPIIVGSVVLWKGSWQHRGLPLFGYYCIPIFGAPYVMLLVLASRNTVGGTKKAVVNGAIFIGYCCGNIAGPYTVLTPERPIHYRTTWITLICAMCCTIGITFALRCYFIWENARRDRLYGRPASQFEASEEASVAETKNSVELLSTADFLRTDRTDKQHFRYSY